MLKKFDSFTRNIIIVFAGTSLANIFGLLFQLLIAHRLAAADFAAFNAMLSIFVILSTPLSTLQLAVAKYSSGFSARGEEMKLRFFLSGFLRRLILFSIVTSLIFLVFSFPLLEKLKISSVSCSYILSGLIAVSWLAPLFTGACQGLELFGWLTTSTVAGGAMKLTLAFIFIGLGFGIAGTIGALLLSSLCGIIIFYIPLKKLFIWHKIKEEIKYKEVLVYLLPLASSNLCFMALVNSDMLLVRYFFSAFDSGLYALGRSPPQYSPEVLHS
ncbi:MAG: oligosaccharide flippase family protein, partial [Candidatus Omnitrophica bacterium]|nr:oligosaccharide flippase family protein [Candidatus Omnitrophota bacterium]